MGTVPLGITQAELAARVGASRLWINQVESGHGGAGLSKVLRLLSALGLSLDVNAAPAHNPRSPSPRIARTSAAGPGAGTKMAMPKPRPVGKKGH